jgi:hypothetical protein
LPNVLFSVFPFIIEENYLEWKIVLKDPHTTFLMMIKRIPYFNKKKYKFLMDPKRNYLNEI